MASSGTDPGLLRCPKNLRECIDWVLRATGKDDQNGTDNINENLKNALEAELKGSGLTIDDLDQLADGLQKFIGYSGGGLDGSGIGKTGGSYESSYNSDKATWEKLCKNCKCKSVSNSNPSRCSCSTSGSSDVCDPKSCCPDCDVRKAAKIFLGMLPCLYYGLKILWVRCNKGGGWETFKINDNNNSLGRFLVGMGYNLGKLQGKKTGGEIFGPLNTLFKDSNGPLDKIYKEVKNYFTPSTSPVPSPDSKSPSTVRSILLWLSGLPFTFGFEALLQHCESLCLAIKDPLKPVKFNDFEASLFDSCFLSPFVLATIQRPGKSEIFYHNLSDISKSLYPEDPFDLFNMLLENVRKIYTPLKFLEYQCKAGSHLGGWDNCAYGQSCMDALKGSLPSSASSSCCPTSLPKGILCTSKPNVSNYHEHCTSSNPQVKCIGLQECKDTSQSSNEKAHTSNNCSPSCPHPLLMFLIDGSLGSDPGKSYSLFKLPEDSSVPPMGFSKDQLPTTAKSGEALYLLLEAFCTGDSSLTRLVQSLTCISRTPPENLGELFVFFQKFVPKLKSQLKTNFDNYVKGEPGGPSADGIMDALQKLYASGSKHPEKDFSDPKSHPYDLFSLNDCHANIASGASCGAYLYSLTGDVYDIFIDSPGMYLSWICYLPKDFKTLLEKFKKIFSSCCSTGSCSSIVKCPCALPLIYSRGFQFMSPNDLNGGTAKKCSDFIDQLGKVLEENSPLGLLIKQIESFLWSIRLPFFLFVLAFWAFVISYFLYVQLYKLDLFHLKSHAHLPKSFKILPSTLFSDASSKLKDLSYFTL